MPIELGKSNAGKPVRLDIDRLVSTRMLLQANSGGGKSWAIRRLLEQTHGQVQQLVIDPEGEFYTLREKLDYVLCGKGGDCPAEPRSAALLARRLLELGCSAVVDIHELKKHERIRFVRLFLEALVDAPRKLWHPALVVIDEADVFAPQAGQSESLSAVVDLMARGRKRGFCGILATQRISKLHKDAAAETNNVFIGRARQDIDRKRAAEELGLTSKAAALELRSLKPGEFFSFGPALDPGDVTRVRFGPVKTSHPREGAGAPPVSKPRAKVKAILGELSDLPAEAEEEARSVDELRAKVRELEAAARKAAKAMPGISDSELDSIREEAQCRAQDSADESIGEIQAQARELAKGVREALDSLTLIADQADRLIEAEPIVRAPEFARLTTGVRTVAPGRLQIDPARSRAHNRSSGDEEITTSMQRVLDAIAWLESIGLTSPYSKVQVAFVAKYKPTSGGYANLLGKLRSADLIDYPSPGNVDLTDAGGACANPPAATPTTEDLHRRIRELITEPMWRCLEPLIGCYPNSMQKAELADAAVYSVTSGGFANLLGKLRTLGLIDYPSPGAVVAQPVLFP